MPVLSGPYHLICLVLVVSGATKLAAPNPPVAAMRSARLPVPAGPTAGIVLGAVEITVGLAAFAAPGPASAAAVAVFYVALVAFVVRLRAVDAEAGCGCFGASSTPPGALHVVLNVASAAIAGAVSATEVPDLAGVADEGIVVLAGYLVVLAVGAGLVLLAPALLAALDRSHASGVRTFGSVR